jgi:hypothetical protein
LSRTRHEGDFALACWDCSKNRIDELQLKILPGPGEPKFDARRVSVRTGSQSSDAESVE